MFLNMNISRHEIAFRVEDFLVKFKKSLLPDKVRRFIGIELDVEDRFAMGKAAEAQITLFIRQNRSVLTIKVTDDGVGIDPEIIVRYAVEKGLKTVEEIATLSPQQCVELIFLPGLSTSTSQSGISGRGVGMDAVKNTVHALRGTICIESKIGRGTSVTIEVPVRSA